jgi:hypothetical protein
MRTTNLTNDDQVVSGNQKRQLDINKLLNQQKKGKLYSDQERQ